MRAGMMVTALVLTGLGISLLWYGCGNEGADTGRIQPPAVTSPPKIRVDVVRVKRGDIYAPIVATGTVEPSRESKVGSRASGVIARIFIREGALVGKNDILLSLDTTDLQLAHKSALAERDMAVAALHEAELSATNLRREKERMENLYRSQVVSRKEYDDIATAFDTASARETLARSQLQRAEAGVALYETQLNDADIRAPFSGLAAKVFVNEGEYLSHGAPVAWIMAIDMVKAEVVIPEVRLSQIRVGNAADIRLDALGDRTRTGTVSRINTHVDPVSRNFTVEIDIPNADHAVKPGMFARIEVKTDIVRDVIVVPLKAIVTDRDGKDAVYVVEETVAHLRPVITGRSDAGMVEIRDGLKEGESVVVAGNFGLPDNTEVNPTPVAF